MKSNVLDDYKVASQYHFACELNYLMESYIKEYLKTNTLPDGWDKDSVVKVNDKVEPEHIGRYTFLYKKVPLFSFSDAFVDVHNFNIIRKKYRRLYWKKGKKNAKFKRQSKTSNKQTNK